LPIGPEGVVPAELHADGVGAEGEHALHVPQLQVVRLQRVDRGLGGGAGLQGRGPKAVQRAEVRVARIRLLLGE
jgi:hypothetical protein